MKVDRNFNGIWIPKDVWLDTRLSALEKVILAEIDSLCCEGDGCYAGNKYIADFCQCSEKKVSFAIAKLKSLGYLTIRTFDGRQRLLKSCLSSGEGSTMLDNNTNNNISIKEAKKPQKHKYGDFHHVLLTDAEYQRLVSDFGESVASTYIRKVDEYCEQFGKNYKNYNLAIRNTFMKRDGIKSLSETRTENGLQEKDGKIYDQYGNEYI